MNQNYTFLKSVLKKKKFILAVNKRFQYFLKISPQIQDQYRTKACTQPFRTINNSKICEGRRSLTLKFGSGNWNISRSLAQNQLSAVGITDHTDFYLLCNLYER